jgi:Rod binding domain-containing protein
MAAFLTPTPTVAATAALSGLDPKHAALDGKAAKARAVAEDFESVFLNNMFQQMFANVGEGPFGGGQGATMWRSFLTDEYAKSFVKAGGIGIADEVQRALLAHQEAA